MYAHLVKPGTSMYATDNITVCVNVLVCVCACIYMCMRVHVHECASIRTCA